MKIENDRFFKASKVASIIIAAMLIVVAFTAINVKTTSVTNNQAPAAWAASAVAPLGPAAHLRRRRPLVAAGQLQPERARQLVSNGPFLGNRLRGRCRDCRQRLSGPARGRLRRPPARSSDADLRRAEVVSHGPASSHGPSGQARLDRPAEHARLAGPCGRSTRRRRAPVAGHRASGHL